MELPSEGIFCVAKAKPHADSEGIAQATAYFPYYFNLTKKQAEVAIKYIAVTPSWNLKRHLELTVVNKAAETEVKIVLEPLEDPREMIALPKIRSQIFAKLGKDQLVRIVNAPGNKIQLMKIKDQTDVTLSPALAELLGLRHTHYDNSDGQELVLPISYKEDISTSVTDIYYLKSDQIASNFFLDGKQDRIIELLHIAGTETVDFHPRLTYSTLEGTLLERLTFTLYNEKNVCVESFHTDLYIVCHIRPKL